MSAIFLTFLALFFIHPQGEPLHPEILVVPKGEVLKFWKAIKARAKNTSYQLNTPIIWRGPIDESNTETQIKIVNHYIHSPIKVLVLAPSHSKLLIEPVTKFIEQGKKVVIFDSDLDEKVYHSFVGTDNLKAGYKIGQYFASQMPKNGKVMIIHHNKNNSSTKKRILGFIKALKDSPKNLIIISEVQAGQSVGKPFHLTLENLKTRPQIKGIFAPNESTLEGAALAFEKADRKDIILMGFDINQTIYQAFLNDYIKAILLQDPEGLGHQAVTQAIHLLKNKPIEKYIYTKRILLTRKNFHLAEKHRLLGYFINH